MQRRFRLRKRNHFSLVYRRGKSQGNRYLSVVFLPGRAVQVGISVSKKLGNAVRRNLVKRRLRECVRPYLAKLRPGRYVVVAREMASAATYAQLQGALTHLLRRGQNLREE